MTIDNNTMNGTSIAYDSNNIINESMKSTSGSNGLLSSLPSLSRRDNMDIGRR